MATGTKAAVVAHGNAAALSALAPTSSAVKTEVPVDHRTVGLIAGPSEGGVMSVALPAPPDGYVHLIERVGISVAGSANATVFTLYVGDAEPQNQVDYTSNGNQAQADEFSRILVPSGQPLTLEWTGATNGAIGYARVQYTLALVVRGSIPGGS